MFRIAVCTFVTDTAGIQNIFNDEINAAVKEKYEKDLAEQVQKYSLSEEQTSIISNWVLKNAKNHTLNKYLHKGNSEEMNKNNEFSRNQREKAIQFLLTEQGVKTSLSNYCTVLELKSQLELSKEQVQDIIREGWKLSQKNKKNKKFKLRDEEHKLVKEILSDDQYDKYLSYKSIAKAKEETEATWNDAEQLGLTEGLDPTAAYNQILAFNLEKAKIRERYKIVSNGQGERDEKLRVLNNNKPNSLRKINSLKKREENRKNQDNNSIAW